MEKISSVKSLFHQIDLGGKASAETKANSTTTEHLFVKTEPSKKGGGEASRFEDRKDTAALAACRLNIIRRLNPHAIDGGALKVQL